jgi:hypothetical protein
VPAFNMFVAGTSCKNFSMLRSTRRIDIEDKGCSGETFLAATEILFKEKPAMAIFENVQCAPWVSDDCDKRCERVLCAQVKRVRLTTNTRDFLVASIGENGGLHYRKGQIAGCGRAEEHQTHQ